MPGAHKFTAYYYYQDLQKRFLFFLAEGPGPCLQARGCRDIGFCCHSRLLPTLHSYLRRFVFYHGPSLRILWKETTNVSPLTLRPYCETVSYPPPTLTTTGDCMNPRFKSRTCVTSIATSFQRWIQLLYYESSVRSKSRLQIVQNNAMYLTTLAVTTRALSILPITKRVSQDTT